MANPHNENKSPTGCHRRAKAELPTVKKGEWVAENLDLLLATIRRDDVYAVTGYKAIGLEVQLVLPETGSDSAQ